MATSTGPASAGNEAFWQAFELKSKNGLTWSLCRAEDIPELFQCVKFLERYCGPQAAPPLFQFPVVLALVARDEMGLIVDGCYLEMICEVAKLGFTKKGTQDFQELAPYLTEFMKARKIRIVQVHARRRIAQFLAPLYKLIGFKSMENQSFFQGRL